jgi:DNA-directed RNA polymerase specialized sigma24 family protein
VDELEALGAGLGVLSRVSPGLARLVDLHCFCGFSFAEIAAPRGVSERTVDRDCRSRACCCTARC